VRQGKQRVIRDPLEASLFQVATHFALFTLVDYRYTNMPLSVQNAAESPLQNHVAIAGLL